MRTSDIVYDHEKGSHVSREVQSSSEISASLPTTSLSSQPGFSAQNDSCHPISQSLDMVFEFGARICRGRHQEQLSLWTVIISILAALDEDGERLIIQKIWLPVDLIRQFLLLLNSFISWTMI